MSDPSDVHMGAAHAALQRANFPYLDDGQWANLEKMEAVNGSTAIGELLQKAPDEVISRIARFREYEIALEEHVREIVTSKPLSRRRLQSRHRPSRMCSPHCRRSRRPVRNRSG
jgi:hypothetical protein